MGTQRDGHHDPEAGAANGEGQGLLEAQPSALTGFFAPVLADRELEAAFQLKQEQWVQEHSLFIISILSVVSMALPIVGLVMTEDIRVESYWWFQLSAFGIVLVGLLVYLGILFGVEPPAGRAYVHAIVALTICMAIAASLTQDRVFQLFAVGDETTYGSFVDVKATAVVGLALAIPAVFAKIPAPYFLVASNGAVAVSFIIAVLWGSTGTPGCENCKIGVLDRAAVAAFQWILSVLLFLGVRREEMVMRQCFAAAYLLRKKASDKALGPIEMPTLPQTSETKDANPWQPPDENHNNPAPVAPWRPNPPAEASASGPAPPTAAPPAAAPAAAPGAGDPADAQRQLRVPPPKGVSPNGVLPIEESREPSRRVFKPNALLVKAMDGKKANWDKIHRMADRIRDPQYSLREFYHDCADSFPELGLFFVAGSGRRQRGGRHTPCLSGEVEYQRTMGALFTVYWLLRLDVDGQAGFCYGVDDCWEAIKGKPPVKGKSFFKMTADEKRAAFLSTMDWSMLADLVKRAGCEQTSTGGNARIMALLALTAIHDIMKLPGLRPIVQPEHSPYYGYEAGVRIHDHDVALSYVLEHFPNVLPSYAGLNDRERKGVLFTQGKMQFNHGWFVQAEAPPGGMLSKFKAILMSDAEQKDIDLYFLHWITDLAGAEATPLGGAEKLVLKFPQKVLTAFLWSMPYLSKLAKMDETQLVEQYLEARWGSLMPDTPVPSDSSSIGLMRLALMAQAQDTSMVVEAFRSLSAADQQCLVTELARTGCTGQVFKRHTVVGGPAFLVYYSPALLQRNNGNLQDLQSALHALCVVLRGARALWPHDLRPGCENSTVIITIEALKVIDISDVMHASHDGARSVWALLRENDNEGTVTLCNASELNALYLEGAVFRALDFTPEQSLASEQDAPANSRVDFRGVGTETFMQRLNSNSSISTLSKRILVFTDMSTECDDECALLWLLAALNRRSHQSTVELVQTDSHVRFQWMSHIFANKLHPGGDWEVSKNCNAFQAGSVRVNLYLAHSPQRETMTIDELLKKNVDLNYEEADGGRKIALRREGSIGGEDYLMVPGGRLDSIVVAAAIPDVEPSFFDRFDTCKCAYVVGTPGGVNCPMPSWKGLLAAMHRLCPVLYLTPQFTRTIRFPRNYVSMNPDWTDTIRHTMWDSALTCMARRPEFPAQHGNWGLVLRLNAVNASFCEEWYWDVTKKKVADAEVPSHLRAIVQSYVDRMASESRQPGQVRDELRKLNVDISAKALGLASNCDSTDLKDPHVREAICKIYRKILFEKVMICVLTTEVLLWNSHRNKKVVFDAMGMEQVQPRCGYLFPDKDLSEIFGSEDALKLLQQLPLQKLTPAYDVVAMICADASLEEGTEEDGGLGLLMDSADETMGLAMLTEEQRNLSQHPILMTLEQSGEGVYAVGPFG